MQRFRKLINTFPTNKIQEFSSAMIYCLLMRESLLLVSVSVPLTYILVQDNGTLSPAL